MSVDGVKIATLLTETVQLSMQDGLHRCPGSIQQTRLPQQCTKVGDGFPSRISIYST